MPCRTDDYNYGRSNDTRNYSNVNDARNYPSDSVSTTQYDKLKKEADNVTRLLCSVMRNLDKNGYNINSPEQLSRIPGLTKWWVEHQEVDRKRVEQEVKDAEKLLGGLSAEAKEMILDRMGK